MRNPRPGSRLGVLQMRVFGVVVVEWGGASVQRAATRPRTRRLLCGSNRHLFCPPPPFCITRDFTADPPQVEHRTAQKRRPLKPKVGTPGTLAPTCVWPRAQVFPGILKSSRAPVRIVPVGGPVCVSLGACPRLLGLFD